jgi:hypothetical protein
MENRSYLTSAVYDRSLYLKLSSALNVSSVSDTYTLKYLRERDWKRENALRNKVY